MSIEEKIFEELRDSREHVAWRRVQVEKAMDKIKEHYKDRKSDMEIRRSQEQVLYDLIDCRPNDRVYYLSVLHKIGSAKASPLLYDLVDDLALQLMDKELVQGNDLWGAQYALEILVRSPDLDKDRVHEALRIIEGCFLQGRKYKCHVYRQCGNWEEINDIKPDEFKREIDAFKERL